MITLPPKKESGQILLVVLLILAVSLTIGLSLISRSITDVEISQETEEAARAFSAAEAGIEVSLITGLDSGLYIFPETGASYKSKTSGLGAKGEFAFPGEYAKGDIQSLWLASYNPETGQYVKSYDEDTLRVVWGNPDAITANSPALEVSIYYQDTGDATNPYKVGRFVLDPYASRSPDPSFCNPGEIGNAQCVDVQSFATGRESVDGKTFQFGATLNIADFKSSSKTLLFARLRFLYSPETDYHVLGAKAAGDGVFPSQGTIIESVGQAGASTRKIEVRRLFPAPPSIFDFLLLSGTGDLEKTTLP